MEGRVIVRSNLAQLIDQKSEQDGERISQYRLSQETGVALNTVKRWLHEAPSSFDNSVVSAFCEYFGCEVGDLLKAVDVGQSAGNNMTAED